MAKRTMYVLGAVVSSALLASGAVAQEGGERDAQRASAGQEDRSQTLQELQERENLSTFVRALQQTGLADAVSEGGGSFTAFAPTDEAFEALGSRAEELMKPENRAELTALLRNHLVVGKVDSGLARNLDKALTVSGEMVSLGETGEGQLTVNGNEVLEKEIQAGNLTVYTIGSVLEPGGVASAQPTTRGRQETAAMSSRAGGTSQDRDRAMQQRERSEQQAQQQQQQRDRAQQQAQQQQTDRAQQQRDRSSQAASERDRAASRGTDAAISDAQRASRLIGRSIVGSGGEEIAEIDDLIISRDGTQVRAVLSANGGGLFGGSEELVTIPVDQLRFARDGGEERIVLAMNQEELKAQPRFRYENERN